MYFTFVAGVLATVALALPALLIIAGRLFKNGSLLALSLYFILALFYNLMELDAIKWPPQLERRIAVFFHYLDAPLMLTTLLFFCNETWKRRLVMVALLAVVLFNAGIAFAFGLDKESSVYLLVPGAVMVLCFTIFFFSHYGKITIVHSKSLGKTFMLVSILFLYGCYLIIYYLYYLQHTPALNDLFLMYYIAQFISAALMSLGLIWINKRNRQIKELQHTRRELALFFDE